MKVLVLEALTLPTGATKKGADCGRKEKKREMVQGSYPESRLFFTSKLQTTAKSTELQVPGSASAEKHSRKQSTLDRILNPGSQ